MRFVHFFSGYSREHNIIGLCHLGEEGYARAADRGHILRPSSFGLSHSDVSTHCSSHLAISVQDDTKLFDNILHSDNIHTPPTPPTRKESTILPPLPPSQLAAIIRTSAFNRSYNLIRMLFKDVSPNIPVLKLKTCWSRARHVSPLRLDQYINIGDNIFPYFPHIRSIFL